MNKELLKYIDTKELKRFSDDKYFDLQNDIVVMSFENSDTFRYPTTANGILKTTNLNCDVYDIYVLFNRGNGIYYLGHINKFEKLECCSGYYGKTYSTYTNSELNEKRKYCFGYVVIAQKYEYEREIKRSYYDYKERKKEKTKYSWRKYDNSGFDLYYYRDLLDDRLNIFKKNRRKNEIDSYNKEPYINNIKTQYNSIIDLLNDNKKTMFENSDDIIELRDMLDEIVWQQGSVLRFLRNRYESIDEFKNGFKDALKGINKMYEILGVTA